MADTVGRFTITKKVDNTFNFTIKADGSTLPMEIKANDYFTAKLMKLSDNTVVIEKPLITVHRLSGKVSLVITEEEAVQLESEKGDKVDKYYPKPMYKLVIECVTEVNGNFIAKVGEVYVD